MLVAWLALAARGAPVDLPPGEDRALWAHPLALSGLEAGPAGSGSGARVTAAGERWRVDVVDVRGETHTLTVPIPTDRAGREALAALVASLVHPVATPMVALPPPRPVPRSAPPSPEPALAVPEPEPAPQPVVEVEPPAEPDEPTPRPLVVLDEPPRPPLDVRVWGGGGPSVRVRPGVRSGVAGAAWVGVALDQRWRVGVGVGAAAPATLAGSEDVYRLGSVDLRGVGAWAPGRVDLGPTAGVSWRAVVSGPRPALVPTAGGTLGYRMPLDLSGSLVAVRVGLLVERDLRATTLDWYPRPSTSLAPISGECTLSVWTR
jgi:hypothetical protein